VGKQLHTRLMEWPLTFEVTTLSLIQTSEILVSGFDVGNNPQMTDNSITVLLPHLRLQRNKSPRYIAWRTFKHTGRSHLFLSVRRNL